jgi:hypothetical protein
MDEKRHAEDECHRLKPGILKETASERHLFCVVAYDIDERTYIERSCGAVETCGDI